MEQQGGLLDHLYLIIINVLLVSLQGGAELTVGVVLTTTENSQNHGQIVVAPAET